MKKLIATILAFLMTAMLSACTAGTAESGGSGGGRTSPGDYVSFGGYNWQVLDVNNGNALVISERILDFRAYNNTAEEVTWENCDLRKYLNSDFYNSFSEKDRKRIMSVKNSNPDNPWDFSAQDGEAFSDGGNDTKDYIFLLSIDDVMKYYSEDGKDSMLYEAQLGSREEKFSDDCNKERIAYNISGSVSDPRSNSWALRTPGKFQDAVSYIDINGKISLAGMWVENEYFGIRPAMWIKNAKSLEKSVTVCNDPDCPICKDRIYGKNPEPDTCCTFCGYVGECTDKEYHNRLYHDWRYNNVVITDEMLEEIYQIEEDFKNEWMSIVDLLNDGKSVINGNNGKIRVSMVVSDKVSNKVIALQVKETSLNRNYRAMTEKQFNEEKDYLINRTELLREVKRTLLAAISEANASSVTFEQNAVNLFKAVLAETVRYKIKETVSDSNRALWDSGYYHALFGDNLAGVAYEELEQKSEAEIDELFGENQIVKWAYGGEAMLDGYLETVFFSGN